MLNSFGLFFSGVFFCWCGLLLLFAFLFFHLKNKLLKIKKQCAKCAAGTKNRTEKTTEAQGR
jgi:hypothetical protein